MQKVLTHLTTVALLLGFSRAFAIEPQAGNISVAAGQYVHQTQFFETNSNLKSHWMGGQSLFIIGDLNSRDSIELSFFHMNKEFIRSEQGNYLQELSRLLQISMGYRRWLSPPLSLGLSFFSSYTLGEPTVVFNGTSGNSLQTSARDVTEYGFDFSIQSDWLNVSDFVVFSDLRYTASVTAKSNESSNHYGLTVGLKYLLQRGRPANIKL